MLQALACLTRYVKALCDARMHPDRLPFCAWQLQQTGLGRQGVRGLNPVCPVRRFPKAGHVRQKGRSGPVLTPVQIAKLRMQVEVARGDAGLDGPHTPVELLQTLCQLKQLRKLGLWHRV